MPHEGQCRNEEDGCMGVRLVRAAARMALSEFGESMNYEKSGPDCTEEASYLVSVSSPRREAIQLFRLSPSSELSSTNRR